ncbi:MAG: hypothetical protein NC115_12915 [Bacteroidales bacterium]|nr:hypothetical protein [Bacteroidales bacterium]
MDYSDCAGISICRRTLDTFDGTLDGIYYVVRIDRRRGSPKNGYRIYPPRDSSKFLELSQQEQWEDEITRHVPLCNSELLRISNVMILLDRLHAECIAVDDECNVSINIGRKRVMAYYIMVQPGHTIDEIKERFGQKDDYAVYRDNWYVHCSPLE